MIDYAEPQMAPASDSHPAHTASQLTKQPTRSLFGRVSLMLALIASGLSAGFMYLWNAVMIPGFEQLDDASYIRAMNGVNSVIRNAPFAFAFFGSFVFIVAALVAHRSANQTTRVWLWLALALYTFVLVVTFVVHVPMNEELLLITNTDGLADLAQTRVDYETRWNAWHLPRAYATLGAFVSVVVATFQLSSHSSKFSA